VKGLREVQPPNGGDCNGCGGEINEHVPELIVLTPSSGEVRRYHVSCSEKAVAQTFGRIDASNAPSVLWLATPEHEQSPN